MVHRCDMVAILRTAITSLNIHHPNIILSTKLHLFIQCPREAIRLLTPEIISEDTNADS